MTGRAEETGSVSTALQQRIAAEIAAAGDWLPFDRYMALALYAPGLGYYARGGALFGALPSSGSDFVTAPELTPLYAHTLAVQVREALDAAGCDEVWEFGAGSGALAHGLLEALGARVRRYHIVELSATLRARQQQRLHDAVRVDGHDAVRADWHGPDVGRQRQHGLVDIHALGVPLHDSNAARVQWHDSLPAAMRGVVIGNEVLDAMPVQLLAWDGSRWHERGVVVEHGRFAWRDVPTALRPPVGDEHFIAGAVTELHTHALAFVRTLAGRLERGVALFVDYGFPEHEYYHPQRHGGTLMCHRAHLADTDPLADAGAKDITAHVDWTAVALAAQDAGLDVLGYTSQARFLLNCGLPQRLHDADARTLAAAQKLLGEHEMGELFKVLALGRGVAFDPLGFRDGDRSHRL